MGSVHETHVVEQGANYTRVMLGITKDMGLEPREDTGHGFGAQRGHILMGKRIYGQCCRPR